MTPANINARPSNIARSRRLLGGSAIIATFLLIGILLGGFAAKVIANTAATLAQIEDGRASW